MKIKRHLVVFTFILSLATLVACGGGDGDALAVNGEMIPLAALHLCQLVHQLQCEVLGLLVRSGGFANDISQWCGRNVVAQDVVVLLRAMDLKPDGRVEQEASPSLLYMIRYGHDA